MKAALALLADRETANVVSRAAWQAHVRFGTGVSIRRLPPHVSLKQPFDIDDLEALEQYAQAFSRTIPPLTIDLLGYALWEVPAANPTSGVLSLTVRETPTLRGLHERLNAELAERFGERRADFDGDAYTFHLTVSAGVGPVEAYRQAFAACSTESVARTFTTAELALFVYDNDGGRGDWQYMSYAVFPLTG